MPRFFIVDQFLRDYQGHNFGYSMSVAEAAVSAGLEAIIVANRDLRVRIQGGTCPVVAWFDHPGHGSAPPRRAGPALRPWRIGLEQLLVLAVRRHAAFHHLWAELNRPAAVRPPGAWRWKWPEPVQAAGRTVRELWASRRRRVPDVAHRFAVQLGAFIDERKAGPADHVFLHTVTFAELAAVRDELALRSPETLPHVHIVLRNDPELDPPRYDLGRCLESFRAAGLWPARVVFYSDTPELVRLYERCSTIPFREIPIPLWHTAQPAAYRLEDRPDSLPAERPLTIAYLGDARPEKGYQWLPSLVQDLWPDLVRPGRVRLAIQSNFNMPGGEPGIAEARNQLLQFPEDRVRLLMEPLSDDTYRQLLTDADLLVVPYDGERYRARSSGVVAEALALGKPFVAPAGTWMTAQAPLGAVVAFDRPDELGAAVRAALDRYPAMEAAARDAAAGWRARHSAPALLRTLLEEDRAAADVAGPGPAILYIMDADAFIFRTGSSSVARNQLDYLRRCGYRVYGALLSMDVANPAYDEDEWRRRLDKALPKDVFARTWLLSYRPDVAGFPRAMRMLEWVRRGIHSLERSAAMYDGLDLPDDLQRFARNGNIAGVFINYAPALRLVERLGLANRPVLCETHDIQTFQHAHYGRRPMELEEFRRECELLRRCAGVIVLSELEADKLAPHLPGDALFDIRPLIDVAPARIADMAGHPDLGSLLRACGMEPGRETVATRLEAESHIDLLFVSTAHWPNIVSFRWFYEEVFLPHLAERGVTLVVAGNIDRQLPEVTHPKVFLTGRLDDLRPLYSAARIVVLPVRMGAGFNIKTMEALAHGKPIVATRFAMRSLAYDPERLPAHDEPDRFASRVLELLSDSAARAQAAICAREVAVANNRPDRYDASMNAACRAAWGPAMPQAAVRNVPEIHAGPLCEWSMAVRRFNRHWRGLEPAAELHDDLARPLHWAVAAELHAALGGSNFTAYARDSLGIVEPPADDPAHVKRAAAARYLGRVEGVSGAFVTGWLIDQGVRGLPAEVEVISEGRVVASGPAPFARADLKAAELGVGGCGFRLRLPVALFDGRTHTLHVRPCGSELELAGSPLTLTLSRDAGITGQVDGVFERHLCGWAWDALCPDKPVLLEVRVNGAIVARRVPADLFRIDLATAGIGSGYHAFRVPLPDHLLDGRPLAFAVLVENVGHRALPGSAEEAMGRSA